MHLSFTIPDSAIVAASCFVLFLMAIAYPFLRSRPPKPWGTYVSHVSMPTGVFMTVRLGFAAALKTSPEFWLDLQTTYTRWILEHDSAVAN